MEKFAVLILFATIIGSAVGGSTHFQSPHAIVRRGTKDKAQESQPSDHSTQAPSQDFFSNYPSSGDVGIETPSGSFDSGSSGSFTRREAEPNDPSGSSLGGVNTSSFHRPQHQFGGGYHNYNGFGGHHVFNGLNNYHHHFLG